MFHNRKAHHPQTTKRYHYSASVRSYLDLYSRAPEKIGERVWCDEFRAWVFAGRSCDGKRLAWIVPAMAWTID